MTSHQTTSRLGKILPLLCAMAFPACGRKEHTLGADNTAEAKAALERVVYSENIARVEFVTSGLFNQLSDLKVTLPQGKFDVSIYDLKLSGSKGTDSIKGAKKLFHKTFISSGTEGPIVIDINKKIDPSQVMMVVSGIGEKGFLQQTILLNADKEDQVSPITHE